MNTKRTLAFLKYIVIKDLNSYTLACDYYFNRIFFFLQNFGFLLITLCVTSFIIVKSTFQSVSVIGNVILFTKLSNNIVISATGLGRLTLLAPSLFPIIFRDSKSPVDSKRLLIENSGGNMKALVS